MSIKQGAMLHDIGKIGVPDAILLKAGALDAEEWQVMRQHVETGARLLEGLGVLDGAREIVLQHHERWDGSGYPRALAADQICVGARIFAVADALDAMLSDRPYRDGMGVQAAVLEIKQCSGSHFDPQVVQAFLKIPLEKWIDVRLQFPEAGGSAQRHSVAG